MTIGIHLLWMDSDSNGGIAAYLKAMLTYLGRIDTENVYRVFSTPSLLASHQYQIPANFQVRVLPRPSSLWFQIPLILPIELFRRPIDLLHVMIVAPPFCPVPYVQTLHDITFETHPELYPPGIRLRLSALSRRSAARAERIITISEHSKRCIVDTYGIPEEKVRVTYLGADPMFRPVEDKRELKEFRTRYRLDGKFILYVGKLQARKNIIRLLRAFSSLKAQTLLPHKLVLIGKKTWMSDEITQALTELDLGDQIRFVSEVPLKDLVLFYNAAALLVFPSLCEGFGLPPLEAMACGLPVVASNATSIPEVVGDAGILVDPYSVMHLAQAMYDVLTQEPLRKELSARGLKQAKRFSNERMACQVLEVYQDVLSQRRERLALARTIASAVGRENV